MSANHRRPNDTSYPPSRPSGDSIGAMYHFGGSNNRGRNNYSFRPRIFERELLTRIPISNATSVLDGDGHKFKDVDDVTDSEEEEMDQDSDNEISQPRSKRRRLDNGYAEIETPPKWSNPDPYTALPPPTETSGKRIDVVKLIRKARNEPLGAQTPGAEQIDFISFDNEDNEDTTFAPPANAPAGPRADRHIHDLPAQRAVPQPASYAHERTNQTTGKRKRGDDEHRLMGAPGRAEFHASGIVLEAWRPMTGISPTPWLQNAAPADSPIVALHKEILDFYSWVRPQEFEAIVREDLISRLSAELRCFRQGELKSFGSYAAGLYLPTGDMDLVYNMPNFLVTKDRMFEISNFIKRRRVAKPGSVVTIAKAKVPIIKFVDQHTGIKVDLSFNNNTGTTAIATFKRWQESYPALPIIVSVVKQALMIRGLNDNSVGGFGGFATICMATCLIQNLPSAKQQNLGELLLEFLNLYGNLLDITTVGIRLDPPGFIDKQRYKPLPHEKLERLMIVDPNRPDNNITGGSTEVKRIFNAFRQMYENLANNMDNFTHQRRDGKSFSFLEAILGGNFTAYHDQRRALHAVYQQMHPEAAIPPPPPIPEEQPPPPPPGEVAPLKASVSDATTVTKKSKTERLMNRIRKLFPHLAAELGPRDAISIGEAVRLGRWGSKQKMQLALDRKQSEMEEAQKKSKGKGKNKSKSKEAKR